MNTAKGEWDDAKDTYDSAVAALDQAKTAEKAFKKQTSFAFGAGGGGGGTTGTGGLAKKGKGGEKGKPGEEGDDEEKNESLFKILGRDFLSEISKLDKYKPKRIRKSK